MNVEIVVDPHAHTSFNFGLVRYVQVHESDPECVVVYFAEDCRFKLSCNSKKEALAQLEKFAVELAKAYKSE